MLRAFIDNARPRIHLSRVIAVHAKVFVLSEELL